MPFRRIALVVAFVVLSVTAVVWWRPRVAPAALSGAETTTAAVASDGPQAASTQVVGATTVAQVDEVAPVMLGGTALRLADIPAGTPLRESLERLAPEVQQRALERLARRPFPVADAQSMRVSRSGMPFYVCLDSGVAAVARASAEAAPTAGSPSKVSAGAVEIASPPLRHSRPGSAHVIYLDFNGHTVSGAEWNSEFGVSSYVCRPYDADGDAATFSESEQAAILSIWARVAEDYSPFDVDVTTEEPAAWTATTLRALITYTSDAAGRALPYSSGATGVAYVGIFGEENCLESSPAFVFYNNLSSEGNIAEVVTHEIGHNFGLHHDGGPSSSGSIAEYYRGHGTGALSWGPIMGASYGRNVSQWSQGQYYRATNAEDDLAILADCLGYRPDEVGNTIAAATALPVVDGQASAAGVIANASDVEVYAFEACGPVALTVTPYRAPAGAYGTNLDVQLELLDASGTVLAANDPEGALAASVSATVPQGVCYVRLSPVGVGTPKSSTPTGYTSYGSNGQYTLAGTVFCRAPEFGTLPAVQATLGDVLDLSLALTGANACTVSGLPAGLSFDPATQHITGRVAALGTFDVQLDASNQWGTANASFTLTVVDGAPRIVSTSAARTVVAAGGSVALQAELFAAQTGVSCQWYHNGRPVAGATSATWTTSRATRADAGWYYLRATNSLGTTQSPTFFVMVTPEQPRLVGWTTAGARLDAALAIGAGSVAGWNWSDATVSTLAASGVVQLAAPAAVPTTPTLALLADGTVTSLWSPASYHSGKPDALAGVVALATCDAYALALKADGTVVGWQASYQRARTELVDFSVPAGLGDVVSLAVGNGSHALAARADGTVVAWCQSGNAYGESTVPAWLAGVVQVAATSRSSLALRTDGTVAAWGFGQSTVPAGLSGVVSIGSAGERFFAIKADGTGVAWAPDSSAPVAWSGAWCNLTALAGNGTAFLGVREGIHDVAPSFSQSPVDVTAVDGQSAVFHVVASGWPVPTYQWQCQRAGSGEWVTLADDAVYEGSATATLRIRSATLSMQGDRYRCLLGNMVAPSVASVEATLTVVRSSLIALSARSVAGTGDAILIMGFVFTGSGAKAALVRGVGPGLPAEVDARLADPQVDLFALRSGAWERVATNDNWGDTSELATAFAQLGCGPLAPGSADAALLGTLADNVYTAHISGVGGTTGVALAEVYDGVVSDKARRLSALSLRNQVGTGGEILIAGFVIAGGPPLKVIVRGVGPALASTVPGHLTDPFLRVYKYDSVASAWAITGENDNWDGTAETSAAFEAVGMSALTAGSKDAALVLTLEPGIYTAQLSGVGGTTGVGLVEIYELP